ncbi:hypothetical protein HP15_222 [Marinobacter adhaerens HP15]|uniref:Uncharacterized protein n=1 Tax=Marinobacter adhaerens (strain DSM 23420 / HP15) TaxID=225937 RepID=E4PK54_MARAH|nr:hypothetical protein HP15_222 [Marinobacter adhaerens HP15]
MIFIRFGSSYPMAAVPRNRFSLESIPGVFAGETSKPDR